MKQQNERILAVVVTYNRLELLKRCIQSLLSQTFKDFDILIINNGSTDGTKEWLDTLPDSIIRIHQDNLGGAGGFYAGQKYGMESNYDWIWMMDDDGVPDCRQLEELLNAAMYAGANIIAPIVLNIDQQDEEAFYPGNKLMLPKGMISENTRYVCPFNGIMFNRSVMENIGLIKKELFIWGDEREYTLRWRNAGYKEIAALKAVHYHPKIKTVYDNVFPFTSRYRVSIKPKHLSKYYYHNNGYINRRYFPARVTLIEGLLYSFYFIRKLELKEFSKFIKYYLKGVLNHD